MKNKLNYAVVGLGVGTAHTRAVSMSEGARLAAICDINPARLEAEGAKYPDARRFDDYDDMLANGDVDVVSICVPSGMHADFACRALAAGKHILIEKPADVTVKRALAIREAQAGTGLRVGVVSQHRWNAVMPPLKEAVDGGVFGKLFMGTFAVKWYRGQSYYDDPAWHGTWDMDGGGSLINQSVHTVDLMLWLMGEAASVRTQYGVFGHEIETEDATASVIRFKSGAVGTLVTTTCAWPGVSTDIQIYGTGGCVEVDNEALKVWKVMGGDAAHESAMLSKYGRGNAAFAHEPGFMFGHRAQVEDMIAAVRDGREPSVTPDDGLRALAFIDAAYDSAKTGRDVLL